ncbi:MAG: response regulator [Oligoflexia bacterium]|nr:response regulator [Oligoflexia bacterium]
MKARILIVDDEKEIRVLLSTQLTREGCEVFEAENGKIAQGLIQANKFDIILSDIRMPEVDGIELLKWVKKTSQIRYILMTSFSDITEAQQAHALGADEFLTKPFRVNDLIGAIEKCLDKPSTQVTSSNDHLFDKIQIEELSKATILPADIYVRLSAEKYLKIAHKDQKVDHARIETYKKKGLDVLFIKKVS